MFKTPAGTVVYAHTRTPQNYSSVICVTRARELPQGSSVICSVYDC